MNTHAMSRCCRPARLIIEDLRIPEVLLGRRCFLTAFPVPLEGCGGAWTRAVAWELA
jgi:hypothetical protein